MPDPSSQSARARPSLPLRRWVRGYRGTRLEGFAPGVHLALPSPGLTIVIVLDDIDLAVATDAPRSAPRPLTAVAASLATGPMPLAHDGRAFDLAIDLSPGGSRPLLGVPARELVDQVIDLADLWGVPSDDLRERLSAARDWPDRFALIDAMLVRRAEAAPMHDDVLDRAWRRLVAARGGLSIAALAGEVGYSRRHLHHRFTTEYGMSPKRVARLARFQHSVAVLRRWEQRRRRTGTGSSTLSELAAVCGYYDQAHLARDWNALAGRPPSTWLDDEDLPFVQDGDRTLSPESVA